MTTPKITPQDRPMQVVEHDDFADEQVVVRPAPVRLREGWVELGGGGRKRSIGGPS